VAEIAVHLLQPKLLTVPDYCYYDRLHFVIQDPDLQPLAFWLCLLQHNHPAVLSPAEAEFRDEVSFRP
jgi:hypothetical protein